MDGVGGCLRGRVPQGVVFWSFPESFCILSCGVHGTEVFSLLRVLGALASRFIGGFGFCASFRLFYVLEICPISPLHGPAEGRLCHDLEGMGGYR